MATGFYHTPESVDLYYKMTQDINGLELINKLIKHISEGSSILELGTGPGHDWEILSQNYKVTGSDLSDEFLKRLEKTHPSGEFLKINAASLECNGKYDTIYSNKVLHHLTDIDLQQSITRQHELLTPQGIICHSFWKGNGTENFQGMFVNNHTEGDIRRFFESNFDILLLDSYQEFEEGDSILLIARKK